MLVSRSMGQLARTIAPLRILGVDPGSQITGFGVIEQIRGRLTLVEQGCIRAGRGGELAARLRAIHAGMVEVIERCRPDVVAVEAPFHGLNVKSVIQLSHARGVILLAASLAELPVFEYSPRSVKSAVVGYGAAEKQQVGKMVGLLVRGTGGEAIGADAADAIAIAICHAHSARPPRLRARG
ncbi:MAG TPA: crossover junction endodeoxyribonuclease RuvC [Thermoanaerobaculia bacterium]|nr:crossover junction endodeoxyribonuclease RuvC [Thermoanaerobaculia bacterium]